MGMAPVTLGMELRIISVAERRRRRLRGSEARRAALSTCSADCGENQLSLKEGRLGYYFMHSTDSLSQMVLCFLLVCCLGASGSTMAAIRFLVLLFCLCSRREVGCSSNRI